MTGLTMKADLVGHSAAFLTQLIWSATLVSTKVLLEHLQPDKILLIRFAIGIAIIAAASPRG